MDKTKAINELDTRIKKLGDKANDPNLGGGEMGRQILKGTVRELERFKRKIKEGAFDGEK